MELPGRTVILVSMTNGETLARCCGPRSVIEPRAMPFTGQLPLTRVDLRAGDVGKTGISMLIAAIEGKREETDHQVVSTEIIKRGSTRG